MTNVVLSLGMVVLLGMLVGCASSSQDRRPALQEITAAAAGLGFDVQYVEPQRFRDPGDVTRVYFPVKFVCGETETNDGFVPASYRTSINVQKGFSPVDRFTKALAVGEQVDLEPIDFPATQEGTFTFVIIADVNHQIRETNEANNTVIGACTIIK